MSTPTTRLFLQSLAALALIVAGAEAYTCCGGSQQQAQTISGICTMALATSPEIQTQASKLNLEPSVLAQQICQTAVLAAQVIEANLPKTMPTACGLQISLPPAIAGASN